MNPTKKQVAEALEYFDHWKSDGGKMQEMGNVLAAALRASEARADDYKLILEKINELSNTK